MFSWSLPAPWTWFVGLAVFAGVCLLECLAGMRFSANTLFWFHSTVIQGFLAALAFAALIGWEQSRLLRGFVKELVEQRLSRPTQRKWGGAGWHIMPVSQMAGEVESFLSAHPELPKQDQQLLNLVPKRASSLVRLHRLMLGQTAATAFLVTISLLCLPFAEAMSSMWLGIVSLGAACGFAFTCLLLTVLIAYYSFGPGRGKP